MQPQKSLLLITFLFLGFWSCDEDLPDSIKINKEIFSTQDQKELGSIFVKHMEAVHGDAILDKEIFSSAYSYVNNIFRSLIITEPITRLDDFKWNIFIVNNDDVITSYSYPGGHVFITTGLLKFLKAESQLAAVIANELYYCNSDLLVNNLVREFGGITMGDVYLRNKPEDFTLTEVMNYLSDMTFKTRDVMFADEMAVEILCPFQYDSKAIAEVISDAVFSDIEVAWIQRYPSNDERTQKIFIMTEDCGEDKSYADRYRLFKEKHLP